MNKKDEHHLEDSKQQNQNKKNRVEFEFSKYKTKKLEGTHGKK